MRTASSPTGAAHDLPAASGDVTSATRSQSPDLAGSWPDERTVHGRRCLVARDHGVVSLWPRDRRVMTGHRDLVDRLELRSRCDFVVDGVLVEGADAKAADFGSPARSCCRARAVVLHVADVLDLDGEDVRPLPLVERKRLLWHLIGWDHLLRFTAGRAVEAGPRPEDAAAHQTGAACDAAPRHHWLSAPADQALVS